MDENVVAIAVGTISDLTKEGIMYICGKLKQSIEDMDEKASIELGDAYGKYIQTSYDKNSKIKTLIYNKEPRDLYSLYQCISVRFDGNEISTNSVNNLLDIGHKIIITGLAGIGKTTLLKHLFLNTLKETKLIPIFVELRGINNEEVKDINILEIIYSSLVNCGFRSEYKYFEYSMSLGNYIIFYDGFDEVRSEISFTLGKEIREASTRYPDNYYIMTSRPLEQFIGWNDFVEIESMNLNKKQALELVEKLEYDKNVKDKFMYELDNGLFEKYNSFASNPLLLNIMLMTFDERATIPDKLNDFYEQAFATLFNVHDGSKDCFRRNIKTGLGCEDFKAIFAYFCFKTYFNSEYEFTENSVRKYIGDGTKICPNTEWRVEDYLDDLVHSVCMLIKDGLTYTFAHRSFQEYFAALYTTKIPDTTAQKLIVSWLTEKKGYADDPYFLMLFNMLGNKFNKIFICPGLKKIFELYDKFSFSLEFLEHLFQGVSVRPVGTRQMRRYRIYVTIKDNYLCSILRMTCLFNGYDFPKYETDEEFISYLTNNRQLTEAKDVSFYEIGVDKKEEYALKSLEWIQKQIMFAKGILQEFGKNEVSNKRKVSSIIDSL